MAVREGFLELGDVGLARGGVLRDARIGYRVHGELAATADNAVLVPHMYSAKPESVEFLFGAGKAIDPARHLVVCPGQLGNGASTSPSTTGLGDAFPALDLADDVAAQRRLLDHLGVRSLELAVGYSMGAQQAYAFAAAHPDLVRRVATIAGLGRVQGTARAYAVALADSLQGRPAAEALLVHSRLWAAVGLGACYRDEAWREAGYASAEDMVERLVVADYTSLDRDDLRAQLGKWIDADTDVAALPMPVLAIALAGDALFPPEDIAAEVARMPRGELVVHDTSWGHYGAGMSTRDAEAIEAGLARILATPA